MILLIETATQIRQKIPERRARRRVPIERRRQRIVDQGETGNLMLADTGERLYGSRNSVEDSWARTMLRGGLRSRDDSRVTVARSRSDARCKTTDNTLSIAKNAPPLFTARIYICLTLFIFLSRSPFLSLGARRDTQTFCALLRLGCNCGVTSFPS